MESAIGLLILVVLVGAIAGLAVFRARRMHFDAGPAGDQGMTFAEAANELGIHEFEVAELVGRVPRWRDPATGVDVVSAKVIRELKAERDAEGPVRRHGRRTWRVLKWLP